MTDMELEFQQLCDPKRLRDMYMIDVEKATVQALKDAGCKVPNDIKKYIDRTWVNSDRNDYLWQFVYNVWRAYNGE